jgi:hypothetical protein
MIKFTAHRDDRKLVGLGLSRRNVERLMKGEPIMLDLVEMDPTLDTLVTIFFGESEREMERDLRERGLIGPETREHIDPRLRD